MAAGDDVENAFLIRHLGHGERKRGVHIAEEEIHLVAVDQLSRLLHRNPGVAAGRILDDQFDWTSENPALGVDLVDGHLTAGELVFAECGVSAGQWIVESDLYGLRGPHGDDERPGDLGAGERQPRLDESATADPARIGVGHFFLPTPAAG